MLFYVNIDNKDSSGTVEVKWMVQSTEVKQLQ